MKNRGATPPKPSICDKIFKMTPKCSLQKLKIFKMSTGGIPEAMPKTSIKIDPTKMQKNQIWPQQLPKLNPESGLGNLRF